MTKCVIWPTDTLRENCPSAELFLVRIFLYSHWIQENTDQKKFRICTLFTQWHTAKLAYWHTNYIELKKPYSLSGAYNHQESCFLVFYRICEVLKCLVETTVSNVAQKGFRYWCFVGLNFQKLSEKLFFKFPLGNIWYFCFPLRWNCCLRNLDQLKVNRLLAQFIVFQKPTWFS